MATLSSYVIFVAPSQFGSTRHIVSVQLTVADSNIGVGIYTETFTPLTRPPDEILNFSPEWKNTYTQMAMVCADHSYHCNTQINYDDGTTSNNPFDIPGPTDGIQCGNSVGCGTGMVWDSKQNKCVPIVGVVVPPPVTSQPPPTQNFPTFTGNPLNPGDVLLWLGQVLQWFQSQLWNGLTQAGLYLASQLWAILPTQTQTDIQNLIGFWTHLDSWVKDPNKAAIGLIEELFKE